MATSNQTEQSDSTEKYLWMRKRHGENGELLLLINKCIEKTFVSAEKYNEYDSMELICKLFTFEQDKKYTLQMPTIESERAEILCSIVLRC